MDLLKRLLTLLIAATVTACAHGGGEREAAREADPPPAARADPGTAGTATAEEPAREISTDRALAADGGAGTLEREASLRVVEEGRRYLIAGQPRQAARRFEHATRIDPTNGFAYYYLGRARLDAGDQSGAVGVLEKAESLLGPYPEWRERTARMLASLGQ